MAILILRQCFKWKMYIYWLLKGDRQFQRNIMKISQAQGKSNISKSTRRRKVNSTKLQIQKVSDASMDLICPNFTEQAEANSIGWSHLMERLMEDDFEPFNEKLKVNPFHDEMNLANEDVAISKESIDFLMLLGRENLFDLSIIGTSQLPVPFLFHTSTS